MLLERDVARALVEAGALDEKRFEDLSRFASDTGMTLKEALIQQGGIEEHAVLEAFSKALGAAFQDDLSKASVPREFVEKVPLTFAHAHNCVAVGKHGSAYMVAISDPADIFALDNVALALGGPALALFALRSEVAGLIDRAYHEKRDIVEEAMDELGAEGLIDSAALASRSEDVLDVAHKPPIIKLVNLILQRALRQRASDVHLQPYEDRLQVRYRIDGILYDRLVIPKSVQEAVISRVKVMGRMDIAEKRLPQDGRASVKLADREVDLRIASVPTAYGERIVMRLLDKGARIYELHELGLSTEDLARFEKLIGYTHGIVLVTGPTGSGKTTTLYAALNELNRPDNKIITAEDPIEYTFAGINQCQVQTEISRTFPVILRAMLRQAPEIILVGEIRDADTAEIAIRAALTGHLVFSTLHTNDAPSAIPRLIDMGVKPYMVASSVQAIMAQRLIRTVCTNCKEPYQCPEPMLRAIGLSPDDIEGITFYHGTGCNRCNGTGFYGRLGIFEMMEMNVELRNLTFAKAATGEIRDKARSYGMLTLREDGLRKVIQGVTTVEEVVRVCGAEVPTE